MNTGHHTKIASYSLDPVLPEKREELGEAAVALSREAAALGSCVHPVFRNRLKKLLSYVNCYYSNLIEGQHMHPQFVEQAFRGDYQDAPDKRNMQLLSRAHIKLQQLLEERVDQESDLEVGSEEFLNWVHTSYYRRVPREFREFPDPDSSKTIEMKPGELRTRNVTPAGFAMPDARLVPSLLQLFSAKYKPASFHGSNAVIAGAASHFRLMALQPFPAGNGHVVRFFSHAWFHRVQVDAGGLWTLSRGIAKNQSDYFDFFKSQMELSDFCLFLLERCRGEVRFMSQLLETDRLLARIHKYVSLRATPLEGLPVLRDEVRFVLEAVMLRGAVARGEIARISGLGERTARSMISSLLDEGLLESDNHKAPVRLGIPTHVIGWWFPNLYPEGMI